MRQRHSVRVAALAVLLFTACASRIDQVRFEGVYRAGRGVSGATEVGVTIIRYRELLGTFSTEVSIAADRAKSAKEREMTQLYADALRGYKDAEQLWAIQFQQRDSEWATIAGDAELKRIVEAYPITGEGIREAFKFKPKEALQVVWTSARGKLEAADQIYNNQE